MNLATYWMLEQLAGVSRLLQSDASNDQEDTSVESSFSIAFIIGKFVAGTVDLILLLFLIYLFVLVLKQAKLKDLVLVLTIVSLILTTASKPILSTSIYSILHHNNNTHLLLLLWIHGNDSLRCVKEHGSLQGHLLLHSSHT